MIGFGHDSSAPEVTVGLQAIMCADDLIVSVM